MSKFRFIFFYFLSIFVLTNQSLAQTIRLKSSGPVKATRDGQIIQNLRISASQSQSCAIEVSGFENVQIRNVEILHKNLGICVNDAPGTKIENARVISSSAPVQGPHCKFGVNNCDRDKENQAYADHRLNIAVRRSDNVIINNAYLEKGAGGLWFDRSHNSVARNIQCFDARGPYPKGNCALWGKSNNGLLENFYSKNIKEISHDLDIINAFDSDGLTVRNGLVDGAFSINGVAVIADAYSDNLTVSNVDFTRTTNAAFIVWAGNKTESPEKVGKNFTAYNLRVKDTSCTTRYDVPPSSGGIVFGAHPSAINPSISNVTYWNHCRSQVTGSSRFNKVGVEKDFSLRDPFIASFPWEEGDSSSDGRIEIDDRDRFEKTLPAIVNLSNGETIGVDKQLEIDLGNSDVTAYWLQVGTASWGKEYYDSGKLFPDTTSHTIRGLPAGKEVVVNLAYVDSQKKWNTITYEIMIESGVNLPKILNIKTGDTIGGNQKFEIDTGDSDIAAFWIQVGTAKWRKEYYDSGKLWPGTTSHTVQGLPNGKDVVLNIVYNSIDEGWKAIPYRVRVEEAVVSDLPKISNLSKGAIIGNSQDFKIDFGEVQVENWWLLVGSGERGKEYYDSGRLSSGTLSHAVDGLPSGKDVFVTIAYRDVNRKWHFVPYYFSVYE